MEYIDRKDTHLKFHRLMQIAGWPLLIIINGLEIATCVASIFNFKLPWPTGFLTQTQQFITTISKGAVTPILTSVILIILALIFLVLEGYTWIGSFKWRKYSYRSWMVVLFFTFLETIGLAALIEMFVVRGSGLSALLGQQVEAAALRGKIVLGVRIIYVLAVLLVSLVLYLLFLYWHKRRKLYRSEDWYEEDENAPEYGRPDVTSSIQPLPQETPKPAPETPAAAPEPAPKPAQEEIVLELPQSDVPERANFIDADNDGVPDDVVGDISNK